MGGRREASDTGIARTLTFWPWGTVYRNSLLPLARLRAANPQGALVPRLFWVLAATITEAEVRAQTGGVRRGNIQFCAIIN
jgi:hypothetical protein